MEKNVLFEVLMSNFDFCARSDLACEAVGDLGADFYGVEYEKEERNGVNIIRMKISTQSASRL